MKTDINLLGSQINWLANVAMLKATRSTDMEAIDGILNMLESISDNLRESGQVTLIKA